MTNNTVFELINRIVNPEIEEVVYTAHEAFATILHGYYYIKPGNDTTKFFKKIYKIIESNYDKAPKMFCGTKNGMPYEQWLWGKMATEAIAVARSLFDKDYYESNCKTQSFVEKANNTSIKDHLSRFSTNDLMYMFGCIENSMANFDAIVSEENYNRMRYDLDVECRKLGAYIPDMYTECEEYRDFISHNRNYIFDYLDAECIVNILCRAMDTEGEVIEYMTKALGNTNGCDAADYTFIALLLACVYELEVFNPVITDVEKLKRDALDAQSASNHFVKLRKDCMLGAVNH